jgi:hypothetical protein
LAPTAIELINRPAVLVAVRCFHGMGLVDSRCLRSISYVRMQHFVRRSTYVPFRRFFGDVRREFMQRLSVALIMMLWAPQSATLCRRAVLMLWHAFLFLGLMLFPLSSFCFVVSAACKNISLRII